MRQSCALTAINDAGTVVGVSFTEGEESSDGFRWRGGRCERLPISDGFIFPADISANGIIVGIAGSTGELEPFYAFLIRGDEVIVVEHPEAPFGNGGITALSAVAPNGLALGWWSPRCRGCHSWEYELVSLPRWGVRPRRDTIR